MSDHLEKITEQHVARSLNEMADPSKADEWLNGQRAKEQAEQIVSVLLAEAIQRLEQGENPNAK